MNFAAIPSGEAVFIDADCLVFRLTDYFFV